MSPFNSRSACAHPDGVLVIISYQSFHITCALRTVCWLQTRIEMSQTPSFVDSPGLIVLSINGKIRVKIIGGLGMVAAVKPFWKLAFVWFRCQIIFFLKRNSVTYLFLGLVFCFHLQPARSSGGYSLLQVLRVFTLSAWDWRPRRFGEQLRGSSKLTLSM